MALPSRYVKGFRQELVVNARLVGHPQVTAANTGTRESSAIFESVVIVKQLIFLFRLPAHIARADTAPIYSVETDKHKILAEAKADPQSGKRGRANSTCCVS